LLFKKNVKQSYTRNTIIIGKSKVTVYEQYSLENIIKFSGFQDPATAVMEGMLNLHHDLMFFMLLIVVYVG